ncbi:MAG: hypothetical protein LUQ50_14520 [Methanospirillum sp.]|uniref:hypothetical protein n=1 Tax=Methanospirillum sp. TaxID=45200 RepID=UPI00236E68E6|nr:hypothetical protein [Methanospirillum sp.]MDD1730268.1 hypothetical protein [Methanospirillum sp.]
MGDGDSAFFNASLSDAVYEIIFVDVIPEGELPILNPVIDEELSDMLVSPIIGVHVI